MLQVTLNEPGRFTAGEAEPPARLPGHALVRIHRIGVCGTDLHAFHGRQPFFQYPRVLGHELGVEVVDPGENPAGLRKGDRCAVEPYLNCGTCLACRRGKPNCCSNLRVMGVHVDGGMRQLVAVPASKLHQSDRLTFDQLALVETLGIGAHAVERAGVAAGQFTLIAGAGPIGLGAIQFALAAGARVAVMDVSERRLEFCRKALGVANTLAPGPELTGRVRALGEGELPEIVIDATGNATSMAGAFDLPAHGGRIVFVGLFQGQVTFDDPNFHKRELTLLASRNAPPGTFRDIIAAIEAGRIDTAPWITHRFGLAEVPSRFPEAAKDQTVIKAMIEVG